METRPTELLSHILNLSNEGEGPQSAQRNLFPFQLVARALFVDTIDEQQAKALLAKLEIQQGWTAQKERKALTGRATRSNLSITRVSHIRRLSVRIVTKSSGKILANLLWASADLAALELAVDSSVIEGAPKTLSLLEVALRRLESPQRIAS